MYQSAKMHGFDPQVAVDEGAKWHVTSGPDTSWHDSGAMIEGLIGGAYSVGFIDIYGWEKPADQSIEISKDHTASISGIYKFLPFHVRLDFGTGRGPRSVALGDLNGDGGLDLAVANLNGYNVSVLLGNGDGSFQTAVKYGVGDRPRSAAIGDLDGDGDLDLVLANSGSDNVSVLINVTN
jgi:hypothetical protein